MREHCVQFDSESEDVMEMPSGGSHEHSLTCREFEEFIARYLEEELSVPERKQFEYHLQGCPHCGVYLEAYQSTVVLGSAAFRSPDGPVPADVPDDLIAAILAARNHGTDDKP